MKVMIDLCIVPIGVGVSLSPYIAACEKVLSAAGLKTALHACGTNVEGEWDEVFAVVKHCYERMKKDCGRISCTIKVDYRKGRAGRLQSKVASVEKKLKRSIKQ